MIKQTYLLISNQYSNVEWSPKTVTSEEALCIDDQVVHWLTRYISNRASTVESLWEMICKTHAQKSLLPDFFRNSSPVLPTKTLILSLESLSQFDQMCIENPNWHKILSDLLEQFHTLINENGYQIGINFSEIFLQESGQHLPSYYRSDNDRIVTTTAEQKLYTGLFSYQFAKAALARFLSGPCPYIRPYEKGTTDTDMVVPSHYFTNEFEVEFFLRVGVGPHKVQIMLTFGPQVILSDLYKAISILNQHKHLQEVIFVFQNEQYANALSRQHLLDVALSLFDDHGCRFLPHIVLLTQLSPGLDLRQHPLDTSQEQGSMSTLIDGLGYYVSDQRLSASRFYHIQLQTEQKSTPILSYIDTEPAQQQHRIGPYVIRTETPTEHYRASKRFNTQQLKSQLTFTVTQHYAQTQDLNQMQALMQQQELTQTINQERKQSQQSHMFVGDFTRSAYTFEMFCHALRRHAHGQVFNDKTRILHRGSFYTQYHLQKNFMRKLIDDNTFLETVVSTIFGRLNTRLRHNSFVKIDSCLIPVLLDNIRDLADGLDPKHVEINNNLMGISLNEPILIAYSQTFVTSINPVEDNCISIQTTVAPGYQRLMNINAFLRTNELDALEDNERTAWVDLAHSLMEQFTSTSDQPLERPHSVLKQLRELIKYYCPSHDLTGLDNFLFHFSDFQRDHLRIFLHMIIKGYRYNVEQFLSLLTELEKRALLEHFYKIYFQYAQTICSITDLLQFEEQTICLKLKGRKALGLFASHAPFSSPALLPAISSGNITKPLFIELMQCTPISSDHKEWPPFVTFAHHFLLFCGKYGIDVRYLQLKSLETFWHKISLMILKYTHNSETETERLLTSFVAHIVSTQGFDTLPVCVAQTVLTGLEQLIAKTIEHGTLEEQLSELGGLSLLWTDVPYAVTHDHLKIVSKEMGVQLSTLKEHRHSQDGVCDYYVSIHELKSLLYEQDISDNYASLIRKMFRYLGGETLREPIAYYRHFLNIKSREKTGMYEYFTVMLLGYFIVTKTGENYAQQLDITVFYQEFMTFMSQKNHLVHPVSTAHSVRPYDKNPNSIKITHFLKDFADIINLCFEDFRVCVQNLMPHQNKEVLSLWDFYLKSSIPKSSHAAKISYNQLPTVFKKRFNLKTLTPFFIIYKEDILNCESIFNNCPEILQRILVAKIKDRFAQTLLNSGKTMSTEALLEKKRHLYQWFENTYPQWTLNKFLQDLVTMDLLIDHFSACSLEADYDLLWPPLSHLLYRHKNIATALLVVELIAKMRHSERYTSEGMKDILIELSNINPSLIASTQAKEVLFSVCQTYLNQPKNIVLRPLMCLVEKLLDVYDAETSLQIVQNLLQYTHGQSNTCPFFLQDSFSADQLHQISELISAVHIPIDLLALICKDHPQTNFSEIAQIMQKIDGNQMNEVTIIAQTIHQQTGQSVIHTLSQLSSVSSSVLTQLASFIELHQIDSTDILMLLNSIDITTEITVLEQMLYARHLERFDVNLDMITTKISEIRVKSEVEGIADHALSPKEQLQLKHDYKILMSYLCEHPVWEEEDTLNHGQARTFTISQLSSVQCQALYLRLKTKLKDKTLDPQKKHHYRLILLGLSCEALYRTRKKFPQPTQILCHLHALRQSNLHIQEVKTGGGKSIISEIMAIMLCAEGWTVDIVTENNELAAVSLKTFKCLYQYLGVPYARAVIESSSSYRTYIESGINHSTPANLSFFRAQMALKKKQLPTHVALLCDEIDAVLTTTVQYRLAGVLDPIYLDLKSWTVVYTELLAFTKENDIFLQNTCDAIDDVYNFKNYFLTKQHDKKLLNFIHLIPNTVLGTLIDSARIPEILTSGVDYLPIMIKRLQQPTQYAAPILNVGTKRPEPSVSYSEGVQQLLHTARNNQLDRSQSPFAIEAITETLMVISAKNFLDFYRLHNGPIFGWTGTAGSHIELQEFAEENGLHACYYPILHADRSEDFGVQIVENTAHQQAAVLRRLQRERSIKPEQPILIITDSPKAMRELKQYLMSAAPNLCLQSYDGYQASGLSEKEIVQRAGQKNIITITNPSLSRGTDFETDHPKGMFEINCAADITESEARQIEGRVARNGIPGQFCHIINNADLAPQTAHIEEGRTRFKAHQQNISLKRQQQRLRTHLLEDLRHHIVTDYLLKIRSYADKIVEGQYGTFGSLIPEQVFLKGLREFNKHAEDSYFELLGTKNRLDQAEVDEFIRTLIDKYHHILTLLFPPQSIQSFHAIEPLIPLHLLQTVNAFPEDLTLDDVQAVSQILATGWRHVGHQHMTTFWQITNDVLDEFQPYYRQECGFKTAAAQVLEKRQLLNIPTVIQYINELKIIVSQFNWDSTINNMSTEIHPNDNSMRPITSLVIQQIFTPTTLKDIKNWMLDYLNKTKETIQAKRWDDLSLPDVNVPWIQSWWKLIQRVFTTLSWATYGAAFAAGPFVFVVTRFIIPTLFSWLKLLAKRLFAGSESTVVQILIGLDNATEDISKAAVFLCNIKDAKEVSVNACLEYLTPLLKNKAILLLIKRWGEAQGWQMEPLLSSIPDLIKALEPYRHLKIPDMIQSEILMTIFIKLLNSDVIKKMLDEDEYAQIMHQIQSLSPDFTLSFRNLTLLQLAALVQVIAHPKFCEFLSALPQDIRYSELTLWLALDTEALPPEVQEPMRALRVYQTNHERIAQETRQSYQNIQQTFALRPEYLTAHMDRLRPQHTIGMPQPELLVPTFWMNLINQQWAKMSAAYLLLLSMNCLLFHFNFVLITILFLASLILPVLYGLATIEHENLDELYNGTIPPLKANSRHNEHQASEEEQITVRAAFDATSDQKFTLFQHARQCLLSSIPPKTLTHHNSVAVY